MHRLINTVVGLLAFVAAAACADANGVNAGEPVSRIREAAIQYVGAHSAPTAHVDAAALDSRLRLPSCPRPLSARGNQPAAGGAWSVAVSCEAADNQTLWSIFVPVRVSDMRSVVVVNRGLSAMQPITSDVLSLETRDVGTLGYGYINDSQQVIGRTLRRPLLAGTVLTPEMLAALVQIKRGSIVTVLVVADGLEIRAQGKALADGGTGDRISIENTGSHRIIEGVVRDGGVVEVGL